TIRSKRLRASVASAAVGMLAAAGAAQADTAQADTAQADPARPNILFILADDLGWTDVQTGNTNFGNGSDYHRTPYVNQLARQGMSFTSAYVTPLCSPTRASL